MIRTSLAVFKEVFRGFRKHRIPSNNRQSEGKKVGTPVSQLELK